MPIAMVLNDLDQVEMRRCFFGTMVPKETINDIFNNCRFFVLKGGSGAYLPNRIIGNKHVIFLLQNYWGSSQKKKVRAVLHESAHYVLKHRAKIEGLSDEEYKKQEEEAWAKVDEWMVGWPGA